MSLSERFDLANPAATDSFGRGLAALARPGDIFALEGPLGSGKTALARAFIRALTAESEDVPSPTFTLVQTYETKAGPLYHFDLYRLEAPEEAVELDIDDAFAEGISLVEWPDRLGGLLPRRRLRVILAQGAEKDARIVTIEGDEAWKERWRAEMPELRKRATAREDAIAEFLRAHGWEEADRRVLAADASFRRYDRLKGAKGDAVLMDAPPPKENVRPFLRIARHLAALGYSAPRILAADEEQGLLLLEDLGDHTFTRLFASGESEAPLYWMATELLIDLHRQPSPGGVEPYDETVLLNEAMLLADWYAPAIGIPLDAPARQAYVEAWQAVLPLAHRVPDCLVLRDFHVDNLMRVSGRDGLAACGLLDFQDALIGPVTYDLVSLLEDARRDIDPAVIATERARYLAAFPGLDRVDFDASWACLAAQRHAKVIGIFTRLCKRDGKPLYLRHIPRVWRLFEAALAHPGLTPVRHWIERHIPADQRRTPEA